MQVMMKSYSSYCKNTLQSTPLQSAAWAKADSTYRRPRNASVAASFDEFVVRFGDFVEPSRLGCALNR